MIAGIPLWVYAAIVMIFFTGFMALRAMKAEKKLEEQFIEKEGAIYIERMEKERQARMQSERFPERMN